MSDGVRTNVFDIDSSVYPSGAALLTKRVPTVALAPGRLSTTNVWPKARVMCSAMARAIMS
jgi:hypothetical protein